VPSSVRWSSASNRSATTDQNGEFRFAALQQARFRIARDGFEVVELDADVQYAARERGAAWADRTKGGNAWFAKALQSQRDFEALWKDAPRYRNVKVKQA